MRRTIQRAMVLQAVQCLDHPTAGQVYEQVLKSHPGISLATVYNNLKALASTGDIRTIADTAERYDCDSRDHAHVKCTECGRICDCLYGMPQLTRAAERETGFNIQSHDVKFSGVCPECRG